MKCFHCEEEARAVCQFCGRAVCREHAEEKPYFSGYKPFGGMLRMKDTAVEVRDAVWCGTCHPVHETAT